MKNGVYTSLDIGTTSIKVIVAEVLNGQMNVIGVGSEKSKGLNKGMIVDIDETVHAIKQAVQQAEEKSGMSIQHLIVGVPANGLEVEPCHGVIAVKDDSQEISDTDVEKIIGQVLAKTVPPERELLSVMLEEFVVDGFDGIKDPRGMVGVRLEIYGTLLSTPKTILHNIRKCVESAGYSIQDWVLQPQAMSQLALSQDEREFGIVQLDIGGGQTTVSAIHEEQVKFVHVEQEGGQYVTKDISIVLNTSMQNAEKLKRDVGYAVADKVNEEQSIQVNVVGQKDPITVKEMYIAEIIEARLAQIFEKIKIELDRIGALQLPGGIKLTGGSAAIPGIQDLAEKIFNVQVDLYIPNFMGVRYPSFTNAIALVYHESKLNDIQALINQATLKMRGIEAQNAPQNTADSSQISQKSQADEHSSQSKNVKSSKTIGEKLKGFFSTFFD